MRPPSQYDAEDIVARSGLDAPQLCSFLGEHYLSFIRDDCLEEAFLAADYLSNAGMPLILNCLSIHWWHLNIAFLTWKSNFLLCGPDVLSYGKYLRGSSSSIDLGLSSFHSRSLLDAAAESVATRGLMFANSCPSNPRGLYKFYAPRSRPVRSAKNENLREVDRVIQDNLLVCTQNTFIIDLLPMFRQLGNWKDLGGLMPSIWAHEEGGQLKRNGVVSGGLSQSIGLHCGKLYHCESENDKLVDCIED